MMRAPAFWDQPGPSVLSFLLEPIAAAYRAGAALRAFASRPRRASIPVVCVGNAVVGGGGKTPTTIAIARRLRASGIDVHCVSRGYGGNLHGPIRVDPAVHDSATVGDEPLLLALSAPTWVARDRTSGIARAAAAGARIALLDDGFQNPTIPKDHAILVIDPDYGIGNGRVVPAGPLREPLPEALSRANVVVVLDGTGRGAGNTWPRAVNRLRPEIPVVAARLLPGMATRRLAGQTVLPFAGIARPTKFFAFLEANGCRIVSPTAFPDHYRFRPEDIMSVVERAAALGARPVTTAKDAVRLPPGSLDMVAVADVDIEFADDDMVLDPIRVLIDRQPKPDGHAA
jgi:tetraacyldisaccharide 4'-kinase